MPYKPLPKKNNRIKVKQAWNITQFKYNSTKWIGLRDTFRDTFRLCKNCQEQGKITPMYVVDHIIPISQGGEPYDWDNLQSLCESCHNAKSAKERKR